MLGNINTFDSLLLLGNHLTFIVPSFHFFLSPICSCWKQGGWCDESNAMHAPVGQTMIADPHPKFGLEILWSVLALA